MSVASLLRQQLNAISPITGKADGLAAEPEEHLFLDAGLTSRVLYLATANWFPGVDGVLPESTNRSTKWFKEVEMDAGMSINPAEQVRLNKLMKKDKTVGIEGKAKLERPSSVSQRLKKMREERAKTAGRKWYDLSRPEMTDELRQELTVLRLQNYARPGARRKGGSNIGKEQHFEIGNIVAPASAYYTDRATSSADGRVRKSAKLGFVDALLQDQEYKRYAKRKRTEANEKQHSSNKKRSKPGPKRR